MSSHTRRGRQARSNTCIDDDVRVKKAKEAFNSLDYHSSESERIREVWQEFRQTYEDTVNNNSNCDTHRSFPIWARGQFGLVKLRDLLTKGYIENVARVSYFDDRSPEITLATSVSQHFKVEPWQFVLHFDHVGPEKGQAIKEIAKQRPTLTFNQLYEEVQKHRLNRIQHQSNPKYEFLPGDFKACLKESNNEDGSNAEHYHEAQQNQAEHQGGNHNGNPENGHPAPVSSTRPNSLESDYTAGHDQEDDLEPVNTIIDNAARHSISQRVSSLPIMTRDRTGETDGESEVAPPIPPTPQAPNVAIRREGSREQSSSLDPLADEGIFSSTEEQLLQDKRSEFLIYESLQATMKKNNEKTENYLKELKEKQVAYAEKMKQVILKATLAHEEDIQPALDGIGHKVIQNLRKRKVWEDHNERRKKATVGFENEAYFKNASL
ncbi:hypothetical protein TGAMA5MH_06631 [Trichoderma gamsii]|uniref:Uncharacterized protein n=1 Tax=Trichoderma gamsii TaxID=398673 RepID=A0A2K0T7P9_9HYPO|nr:hypothetical protein TGAMA5MH_06631 [Trichoderma gamsii]